MNILNYTNISIWKTTFFTCDQLSIKKELPKSQSEQALGNAAAAGRVGNAGNAISQVGLGILGAAVVLVFAIYAAYSPTR